MKRFSIEVSRRKVAAGRDAKTSPAATPCDSTSCECIGGPVGPEGASMRKADPDPEVRRPQDLSPLSDD